VAKYYAMNMDETHYKPLTDTQLIVFKNSVLTSQFSLKNTNCLILSRDVISIYCDKKSQILP
jgi:hypothetical protein